MGGKISGLSLIFLTWRFAREDYRVVLLVLYILADIQDMVDHSEAGDADTMMDTSEITNLLKEDNDEDETHFYKEAFDWFDWNHSGRINTSVSRTRITIFRWASP